MRRVVVLLAVLLSAFPVPVAHAQFGTPQPGSEFDAGTGRSPRQPRSSVRDADDDDQDEPVVASPAPPVADEPAQGETGGSAPDPLGVARSNVRSHADVDRPMVALTLDDGYRPDPRILELIESYGIHGTAFIVGEVADSAEGSALINELARLGWLVCSHTYSHAQLTNLSPGEVHSQIVRGIEAVERVVGYRCPYFRAPFGSVNGSVVAEAEALGVEIIGWEASLSDSAPEGTDPDLQLSIAQHDIRPGSIVLGHFGATNSYEVLSRLLAWLSDGGYGVGSVAELIEGNIPPLGDAGSPDVTVDLPDATRRAPAATNTSGAVNQTPVRSDDTVFLLSIGALALKLPRPRRRGRIRTVAAGPETWHDELGRLTTELGDTVPEWEAPPERAAVTTEGWT